MKAAEILMVDLEGVNENSKWIHADTELKF